MAPVLISRILNKGLLYRFLNNPPLAKTTSSWYSTTDLPGVMAFCGSAETDLGMII